MFKKLDLKAFKERLKQGFVVLHDTDMDGILARYIIEKWNKLASDDSKLCSDMTLNYYGFLSHPAWEVADGTEFTGYDPDHILMVDISPKPAGYKGEWVIDHHMQLNGTEYRGVVSNRYCASKLLLKTLKETFKEYPMFRDFEATIEFQKLVILSELCHVQDLFLRRHQLFNEARELVSHVNAILGLDKSCIYKLERIFILFDKVASKAINHVNYNVSLDKPNIDWFGNINTRYIEDLGIDTYLKGENINIHKLKEDIVVSYDLGLEPNKYTKNELLNMASIKAIKESSKIEFGCLDGRLLYIEEDKLFGDKTLVGLTICEELKVDGYVTYHQKHNQVSFRLINDKLDASMICREFGGGGHPRAAGFQWKDGEFEAGKLVAKLNNLGK